ncbi:LysR substrate-binding domain-containing protein [Sphingobium subterraneum]|uniref:LysR family glycine cleavage system transcriptional activator n=1 Tax=Sphingobium subterraneum TaxID=627688 RepID=A0A841J231_9SPHN|nr:LysR substrate-binding domain-containing protein [Sphingobium subterraneum]MBB6124720.1 LysR family glycine cleavage system transcriptional activator [Sphingobium subterraneum]
MRRLPPLTALEAFVQVARLGSVKAAAEELALSTPALSRRLQALERYIGRTLFERKHQAMEINSDGVALLNDIAPALDAMSVAVEKIISGGNQLRLRLAVLPLFASQRLFPHLGELREAYPSLHIDIETTPHAVARLGEGLDAAILLARDIDPSLYSQPLSGVENIHLIASAALIEKSPLTRPSDLAEHTVLLHRDMSTIFDDWKDAIGQQDIQPVAIDSYDSGPLMLEAAAQGLGIAVMLESHFREARDSRLVRLLDSEIESSYRYYFVCRPRALQIRAVKIFHDWLISSDI